jgi:hypothetical protein
VKYIANPDKPAEPSAPLAPYPKRPGEKENLLI